MFFWAGQAMMKVACLLVTLLVLCAGAHAATSFDLVKGSPVSASVTFDLTQAFLVDSLTPVLGPFAAKGRRHLLAPLQPANVSSVPGAAEVLRRLTTGSNTDLSTAGRHLLQTTTPTTFHVPISLKESALGGFVSAAFDFSNINATAFLTFVSQFKFQYGTAREAAANVQIIIYTDVSSDTSDIVDVISTGFFLDSSGKGRMEKFGFGADVTTIQTTAVYMAIEIQFYDLEFSTKLALIPATDITVEKASLPTVHGILDTLC